MPLLDCNGLKPVSGVPLVTPDELDAAFLARADRETLGVALPNSFDVSALESVQDRLELISIDFPVFNDGRGFTLARMLRKQGYRGTLRARGSLVPDQFAFALECGFDEVEIDEERLARQPVVQWQNALAAFDLAYQKVPGRISIFERRRAAREAA